MNKNLVEKIVKKSKFVFLFFSKGNYLCRRGRYNAVYAIGAMSNEKRIASPWTSHINYFDGTEFCILDFLLKKK